MTEALQKAENHSLAQEEEIIEKERKRIARDLHDTVSQELFAAHMILSGISQQALKLDREKMQPSCRVSQLFRNSPEGFAGFALAFATS